MDKKNKISTFLDLYNDCKNNNKKIYEISLEREADLKDIEISEVRVQVKASLVAMKDAIEHGLKSSELSISGMCGNDCEKLQPVY